MAKNFPYFKFLVNDVAKMQQLKKPKLVIWQELLFVCNFFSDAAQRGVGDSQKSSDVLK
jgi:hypothetical protein